MLLIAPVTTISSSMCFSFFISNLDDGKLKIDDNNVERAHLLRIIVRYPCCHKFKLYFSFFISVDEKLKKWWQQWQRAHHLRIVAHCSCYHNFKLNVFFFLHFQSRWWKTQNWWQQCRKSTSLKNCCSLPLLSQIQARSKNNI